MPTRRSRRLATSAEEVRSLGNNAGKASEEAFLTLASVAVEAIEYKSRSVASDYGLYPVEITGNGMCHLRALYNVSPVAAKVARKLKASWPSTLMKLTGRCFVCARTTPFSIIGFL